MPGSKELISIATRLADVYKRQEFKLLHRFCLNPGQVLTRQILLEKLWDQDGNFVDEHTLTINISRLRAKIADEEYAYIKTIYGGGYKWIGESHE